MLNRSKNKIEVLHTVPNFLYSYDFEGEISKVAETIRTIPERLITTYPFNADLKAIHKISIRIVSEYDYGDDSPHPVYYLDCFRWETDEEFKSRQDQIKEKKKAEKKAAIYAKKDAEQKELELFERLKKKYG